MFSLSWLLVLVYTSAVSFGSNPDKDQEALPSPPWVLTQMPALSQWTVEYSYADKTELGQTSNRLGELKKMAAQDAELANALTNPKLLEAFDPDRPLLVRVVKTNDVRYETRESERHSKHERWSLKDVAVERVPNSSALNVSFGSLSGMEFPEFVWITERNFIGRQKVNGLDGLVFQQEMSPIQVLYPEFYEPDSKESKVMVTAVIDPETKLPRSITIGTELRKYTFYPAPTQILSVPEELIVAIRDAEARIKAATKPLSRP